MPREREYESNAERQAAYRARQRELQADREKLNAQLSSESPTAMPSTPPSSLPISEDEYVKLMLSEPAILDEKRAERYARWRYRGVLEGRVASL
jgi:hypothetical protein